jgi:nucleoside-diphosphate-sugar epimerase
MRILVTGGGGYIGSVLIRKLIERGHEPVILDRMFFGDESIKGYECMTIREDIRNFRDEWLDGIAGVIHLAGLSNDPTSDYKPHANHQMNVVATKNLVKACIKKNIRRFTFASSASIYDEQKHYGDGPPPMRKEQDIVSPRGAYSCSKYEAENIIKDAFSPDFCAAVFRQGTVYGYSPRMRFDLVVNTFVKDALTKGKITLHDGGSMWRPLIDVDDVANCHIDALEKRRCGFINLVGENLMIRDVAGMVAGAYDLFFAGHGNRRLEIEHSAMSPAIKRNYRISGNMANMLGFVHSSTVFKSAYNMFEKFSEWTPEQLMAPQYYNVRYMELLENVHRGQCDFSGIYDLKVKA